MKSHRHRTALRRRIRQSLRHRPLRCELLEERNLLATFADADNNNSVSTAQLLYNDTSYTVNGRLATHADLDFFTFYAKTGDNITATARAVFDGAPPGEDQQLDPMVAIYNPSGSMVQQDDDGGGTEAVPWTAVSKYAITETGFWTVAVTDYPDHAFDGTPGEGPGLNVGKYQLTIEGASKMGIEGTAVTAQYDRSGNGDASFGTYLPNVSLLNEFTVDLGFELPDSLAIKYRFGGDENASSATRSGQQFTFTKDMGTLIPKEPGLTVTLVHADTGSTLDTYSANVLFVKDLVYELEFDGIKAEQLRLIGSEISEDPAWPVKATLPSNIDFFDQYKSKDLRLEVKSKGTGSRTATTLAAQGDGTYTGLYQVNVLADTVKSGRDYDLSLMGTLRTPSPFTKPLELLVVSLPKWINAFTVATATYSNGSYDITLNTSKWDRSVDPAKVDPFGLVEGKKTGVTVDAVIQVIASRDLDAESKPEAKLNSASVTATLLGEEKAKYSLKDQLKVESSLVNETLDIQSLRIFNDPKSPIQIASEFFRAYNQSFQLPSYLQKFNKLGINADLSVGVDPGPVTANVSLELAKVGDSVEWIAAGTFVELMASVTGSVSVGAGLNLLSIGGKGLVGVNVEGTLNVAIGAKVRFEAEGNLLKPTARLNTQESGATLGLAWQIRTWGTFLFFVETDDYTFKSDGVKTYQLLGSYKADVKSMIKEGTGVSSGGDSEDSNGDGFQAQSATESADSSLTASSSSSSQLVEVQGVPTVQGTLRHLEIISPSVSNVTVQVQSFADRANVSSGRHRLDVVLVGLSSEVHLGSFDPADQTHQADTHPLGFAAPVQQTSFPIEPGMVDPNEIYQLEFRYLKDGDAGGEVVEYEVHDVQLTIPQTDYTLTTPLGSLEDATLTFGPETAQSPVGSLLLTNNSSVDLTLARAEIVGGGFELLTPIEGPVFVQAGQALSLEIRLLDTTQPTNAVLQIESNAPGKETFDVTLDYDPAAPVDATAPEILATRVRGSSWGAEIPSLPTAEPLSAYGNLDRIEVVFSEDVDVQSTDLRIIDENGTILTTSVFDYSATTDTATWTLTDALTAGRYVLEWIDSVHDTAGNPLAPVEPSELSIVPGDANNDGSTDFQDFVVVSNNFGQDSNGAVEGDFNGDGVTNFADFVILSNDFGTDQSELTQPNYAPSLDPIPDQAMVEGAILNLTATASDANLLDALEFSLVESPDGATIDPLSGTFEYTAPTGIGISEYPITIRVTDNGHPARWAEQSFLIRATPVNLPPALDPISAQSVEQGGQLLYRGTASDGNDPIDTLVFSLDEAPAGAEIDSDTGMIAWEPGFEVPPGDVNFTVRVTDSFSPTLFDTTSFTVTVTEFNLPPTIDPVPSQAGNEGELISFTATATDPNVGTVFTYSLGDGAPTGAVIDPVTGEFSWTPAEDQGPGNFLVTVIVTDNGEPSRRDDVQVSIQVDEVNQAPLLTAIGAQQIEAGQQLLIAATATDNDEPENTLTFSLDDGAPAGASIDPVTGEFQWTPGLDDVGTFDLTIRVTDDGIVPLDDFETINVEVTPETQPPQISAFMTEAFRDQNVARIASITGSVVDASPIVEFHAGFGETPVEDYADILSEVNANDEFLLDESRLAALNGEPLGEGTHTLHFRAVDANGNVADFDYVFQIDLTRPTLTLDFDPDYDSAPLGDRETHFDVVTIVGQTEPFASVYLDYDSEETYADAEGVIRWDNIRLELGDRTFNSFVTDQAGNTNAFETSVTRFTDAGCVGPDLFGYQACVATPEFTDISATGTLVWGNYEELGPTELEGFDFEFYGNPVDNLFVNRTGLITFDEAFTGYYPGTWSGDGLMRSPVGGAIAPLWDDVGYDGDVFWELTGEAPTRQLIVQWQDVTIAWNFGNATFQAVLNEADDSIQFNYFDLDSDTYNGMAADSTVGIKPPGTSLPPTLRLAYGSAPNELVGTGLSTLISLVTPDTFAPMVTVSLSNDTGGDPYDGLTNDPTIVGGVYDSNTLAVLRAGLDATPLENFTDILPDLQPDGTFLLDMARLEQIHGGTLPDGAYTLHVIAEDSLGNSSAVFDVPFQLDTVAPIAATLTLAPESDSEPLGDNQTNQPFVWLTGQTEPDAMVEISGVSYTEYANWVGNFKFYQVLLLLGQNDFTINVTDRAGNVTSSTASIERIAREVVGPDDFGYEARPAEASFVDISTTGTMIPRFSSNWYRYLSSADLDGFTFSFYGATYDGLYISDNGVITFGEGTTRTTGDLRQSTYIPTIAPLWDDLRNNGTTGSGVYWEVLGNEGDRQLVVQWNDFRLGSDTGTITFQAILHESDGSVDFNYADLETAGPGLAGRSTVAGIAIGNDFTAVDAALVVLERDGPNEFVGHGLSTRITLATPDVFAPLVTAKLANDTGLYTRDRRTNDPAITGIIRDGSTIASLRAGLDDTSLSNFIEFVSDLLPDGTFLLDAARMEHINGGPLADGPHRLQLIAEDALGNVSNVFDVTFDLDTQPPNAPTLNLDPAFDTEPLGDLQTEFSVVTLLGQTEPFTEVTFPELGRVVYADADGQFQLTDIELAIGQNDFTTEVTDDVGNVGSTVTTVTRLPRTSLGPDVFGYEARVVTPEFHDISSSGTSILAGADNDVVEITAGDLDGFQFSFYGTVYNSLFVNSNGLITFGSGVGYAGGSLLSSLDEPGIAAFWDDLIISGSDNSAVYWELSGAAGSRQLVVQWHDVSFFSDPGTITFQVVLDESDDSIQLNYLDLDSGGISSGGATAYSGITAGYSFAHLGLLLETVAQDGPHEFLGTGLSTRISLVNPDSAAPLVLADLAYDSGDSDSDKLTNDPTIDGRIIDASTISVLRAGFDATQLENFTDILADLRTDGTFFLDAARIAEINGSILADGLHTLHLYAEDAIGNASPIFDVQFEYDTQGPIVTGLALSPASDSFPQGDNATKFAVVDLIGQTEPYQILYIEESGKFGFADGEGNLLFTDVTLQLGQNDLTVTATDAAGNTASYPLSLEHVAATEPDAFGYQAYIVAPEFIDIRNYGNTIILLRDNNDTDYHLELAHHGFEFSFYGVTYDSLFISNNGLITFDEAPAQFAYGYSTDGALLDTPNSAPAIAPFWDDLSMEPSAPYFSNVLWELEGDAGSRQLIIQWEGVRYQSGGDQPITFQVVLSEYDGTIQFNYLNLDSGSGSYNEAHFSTVGIKGPGTQELGQSVLRLIHHNLGPNEFVGSYQSTRIVAPAVSPPPSPLPLAYAAATTLSSDGQADESLTSYPLLADWDTSNPLDLAGESSADEENVDADTSAEALSADLAQLSTGFAPEDADRSTDYERLVDAVLKEDESEGPSLFDDWEPVLDLFEGL